MQKLKITLLALIATAVLLAIVFAVVKVAVWLSTVIIFVGLAAIIYLVTKNWPRSRYGSYSSRRDGKDYGDYDGN